MSRRKQTKHPNRIFEEVEASTCRRSRLKHKTEYGSPNETRRARRANHESNTNGRGSDASVRKQSNLSGRLTYRSGAFEKQVRQIEARFKGERLQNDTARTTTEHTTTPNGPKSSRRSIVGNDNSHERPKSSQKVDNRNETYPNDSHEGLVLIPSRMHESVSEVDDSGPDLMGNGVNDAAFDNPTDGGVNDSASDNPDRQRSQRLWP